jgi:hypothetical protein
MSSIGETSHLEGSSREHNSEMMRPSDVREDPSDGVHVCVLRVGAVPRHVVDRVSHIDPCLRSQSDQTTNEGLVKQLERIRRLLAWCFRQRLSGLMGMSTAGRSWKLELAQNILHILRLVEKNARGVWTTFIPR